MYNFITFKTQTSFFNYVKSLSEYEIVQTINSVYNELRANSSYDLGFGVECSTYFKALMLLFDYSNKSLPFGSKYANIVAMIDETTKKLFSVYPVYASTFDYRCMEIFNFIVQKAVSKGVINRLEEYESVVDYIDYKIGTHHFSFE